jgi:hypothetical protein
MKGAEAAAEPIAKKTKIEDPPAPTPQGITLRRSAANDERCILLAKSLFYCNVFSYYRITMLINIGLSCHSVFSRFFVLRTRLRGHDGGQ